MHTFMDEKTLVEEEPIMTITNPSSPPSYNCVVDLPPPPTYLQSSRLHYKNRPFISEQDEIIYNQEQERQQHDNYQADTLSDIAQLPLHKRMSYYLKSWTNTVYDGRLVFFAFFVLGSLTVMAIVLSVMVIPSVLKH